MASSYVNYTADGVQDTYTVPFPYIEETHVKVYVDGALLLQDAHYEFSGPSQIRFLEAQYLPAAGQVIEIRRETAISGPLVSFLNGAILTANDLNVAVRQNFYLNQETRDYYEAFLTGQIGRALTQDVQDVLDQATATILSDAALANIPALQADVDANAQSILDNVNQIATEISDRAAAVAAELAGRQAADANLQTQINAIAAATAGTVYVQATAPVPGVGGVPNPIPDYARWYDTDDNNKPYVWDGVQWISIEDPRIGQNEADIAALEVTVNNPTTGVVATSTALGVLDTTVVNLNGVVVAQGSDITTLQSTVNNPTTGVAANASGVSSLNTRVTTAEGTITAHSSDITALQTTVNNPTTGVVANAGAVSALGTRVTTAEGTISVHSSDITLLNSNLTTTNGNVTANASAIGALDTRVTSAEGTISSHSSSITSLQSEVDLRGYVFAQNLAPTAYNVGDLWIDTDSSPANQMYRWNGSSWVAVRDAGIAGNASAISGLDTRVTTAEGTISAHSTDITNLQSSVTTANGNITNNANAISALDTRVTSAEGTLTSQASQITSLQAEVDLRGYVFAQALAPTAYNVGDLWIDTDSSPANQMYRWNGTAWVAVRDAGIAGNASAITAIDTRVTSAEGTISSHASSITSLNSSVTTLNGQVSTAQVDIAANTSAIVANDGEISTLFAKYGVTLNVNGYITGFSQHNNGTSGSFVILADKFAIVDPSGDPAEPQFVPFSVSGGVVYMQNVVIGDALISNLTVSKLTSGSFANGQTFTHNGDLNVGTTGRVRGGMTSYATGTGFFLGYEGGAYKFSVGDSSKYIRWDGSTFSVGGDIIATGNIIDGAVSSQDYQVTTTLQSQTENVETTVATATVTTVAGKPVALSSFWNFTTFAPTPYNSAPITTFKLKRGATVLLTWTYTGVYATYDVSRFWIDNPGAGTFTYTITATQRADPNGDNGTPQTRDVHYIALEARQLKR